MVTTTKLNVFFAACIIFFMQFALLQHEFNHVAHELEHHHDHETTQECQLCLGTHYVSQFILSEHILLSLSLVSLFVLFFHSFISFYSPALQLPRNRAPPVKDLFN